MAKLGITLRRWLGLVLRLALGLAVGVLVVSGNSSIATVSASSPILYTVNTTQDDPGSCSGPVSSRSCTTLRAAVTEAAANNPTGNNIITLPAGTITLSSGLVLTGSLTIMPAGVGVTTLAGPGLAAPILTILSGTTDLQDLTVAQGIQGGVAVQAGATLIFERGAVISNSNTGLYNAGIFTATNTTLSGNSGGALVNDTGGVTALFNVTVVSNTGSSLSSGGLTNVAGGALTVTDSIVSNNSASTKPPNCFGTITSGDNNLIGTRGACTLTPLPSDQVDVVDARLAGLQYNGGAALTHALLADSPALDHGANCPATDGRGAARPQGAACDIGAYELPIVSLLTSTTSVSETAGAVGLAVKLDKATVYTVTVPYATSDLTALAGRNYTATAGTVTIAPLSTTAVISVSVLNDGRYAPDQTFKVDLLTPGGAGLGITRTTTVTITNTTPKPVINFTAPAAAVTEAAGRVVLTAVLDQLSQYTTTVDYALQAGTAQAGADYTPQAGTLIFPPLTNTQLITVAVAADGLYENDEYFTAQLGAVSQATLGPTPAVTITLQNSDPPPQVAFQTSALWVREDAGLAALGLQLSAPSAVTATARYTLTGGTAQAGVDYTLPASGTVTFTPGLTQTTLPFTVLNDPQYYGDRTLTVALTPVSAAAAGAPLTATVTFGESTVRVFLPALTTDFNPAAEREPNDSFETATGPLVSGQDYFGTNAGRFDLDYFYFNAAGAGAVQVEAANLLQGSGGAQVVLCSGSPCSGATRLGFAGGYTVGTSVFRLTASVAAGRYWVVVVTPAGYAGGQYTLRVTHP